jgi:hypothetical protein
MTAAETALLFSVLSILMNVFTLTLVVLRTLKR